MNNQNKKTFHSIYEAYFDHVYYFILQRVKNKEEAQDLVQEVFLKVLTYKKDLEQIEAIESFLFTICRNLIIDHYRKTISKDKMISFIQLHPEVEHQIASHESEPLPETDHINLVLQYIEDLPEQRREIFKRKKLQGKSTAEIACEFSISNRTVENQVYRAMMHLRNRLTSFFL